MRHLAIIQSEFLKEANKWDKLSIEQQRIYLKKHPKSKKKITAKDFMKDFSHDEQVMYLEKHPKLKKHIPVETTKDLENLIKEIWSDDVSFDEATEGFSEKDIQLMQQTIASHSSLFKNGVPFAEDSKEYAKLLKTDKGAKLLQKMIDKHD